MPNKFPVPPTNRTKAEISSRPKFSSAETAAFRDSYQRYQECLEYRGVQSSSNLNENIENYVLDFELAAKRSLANDAKSFHLFRLVFLKGHAAEHCCSVLKMDRFSLQRASLELESIVGAELVRRGLFPVNKYFTKFSRQTSTGSARLELLAA